MWTKDKSLALSIILVRALFVFIIILALCVPIMVHWYDITYTERVGLVEGSVFWPLSICLYAAAVCGEACLWFLGKLLLNIREDKVFIPENCTFLRLISWFCLLAAVPFFVFGFWRYLGFIVALAAVFFGILIRVIKNCFEKAVLLQEENDFTI